jgi:hypothetical protein
MVACASVVAVVLSFGGGGCHAEGGKFVVPPGLGGWGEGG